MTPESSALAPSRPSTTQETPSSTQDSQPTSRRASQIYPMSPPAVPAASSNGLAAHPPSNTTHQPFPPLSPSLPASNQATMGDSTGPARLPRAMTPAELHTEMEREQEAVVNRLTRELNALRAHSTSITSTTSSVSTSTTSALDMPGPTHPTASRRHRSSSTTSQPLLTPQLNSSANITQQNTIGPLYQRTTDPSTSAIASTPSAMSRQNSNRSTAQAPTNITSPRYEDAAQHRAELEEAKKENERLRKRVRELEAMVRGRRTSSVSTSASLGGGNGSDSRERSVSNRGAPRVAQSQTLPLAQAGAGAGES